jgi:Tol biopolymer transport system component/DNA-binding winged helix-turn-helix (wHTH) protein
MFPMSVNSSCSIVRFGTFELNVQTGELRQRGQRVRLQEQPLQVLVALLERPGELVTREELRSKLWPEDTFVDFDHGLNAAIKRLRDALGESADTPVFIETLARRGYRFIAPVNGSSAPSGIEIAQAPDGKSPLWAQRIAISCFSVIVVAVLVWAVWRLPMRPIDAVERKLTSNSSENNVNGAGISPDGKYLAYSDDTGVYLKQLRTGDTHLIPLPPNFSARVDDWFPDGAHLLVSFKDQSGKASLWSISVFGGSPRPLADDASGGSVSPDGARVAFRRAESTYDGLLGREIWVMRSDGTDPIKVAPDKGSRVGTPAWSSDGKWLAYVRAELTYDALTRSVELNQWETGNVQTLLSDKRLTSAVDWLADGRLVYALDTEGVSGPGDSSVWAVSLTQTGKISESPKRLTQGAGAITQVSGSDATKALIVLRERWSPSIFIGTLSPDGTQLRAHRRLTLDESASIPTSWTPDSAAVLFYSDRNGALEIFKQANDRPLAERLAGAAEQLSQPRVTPDGSEILYVSTPRSSGPETRSSVFAIPLHGGAPRLVLKEAGIFAVECARAPSAVCLYSISKGNTRVTFPFDARSGKTTGPPQMDPEGFWSLSPDGSLRAFIAVGSNQGTIQLRSTSSSKTRDLVVKGWNGLMHVDWSADGSSLFVGWHGHRPDSALLKVTLDGHVSVLLRSKNFIGYAIPSPDGRLLAILEVSPSKNVWQIENF